jgi:hypothetical protein
MAWDVQYSMQNVETRGIKLCITLLVLYAIIHTKTYLFQIDL